MDGESANKFMSALVKSIQALCQGYVDFEDGIEIIGHIYLNVDSCSSFDYVVKEKIIKNSENTTEFVSKSFQAHSQSENNSSRKQTKDYLTHLEHSVGLAEPEVASRLQSAIDSISNVLPGQRNRQDHVPLLSLPASGKRKRDFADTYDNISSTINKYTALQSPGSSLNYYNNQTKEAQSLRSSNFANSSHSDYFTNQNNQNTAMAVDEEDDLHLDVTFVKEEQHERNQRNQTAASRHNTNRDPPSNDPSLPHDNGNVENNYSINYSHHFAEDGRGDITETPLFLARNHPDESIQPTPAINRRTAYSHQRSLSSPLSPADFVEGSFEEEVSPPQKKNDIIHTIRQNKWAVNRIREWLKSNGMTVSFEEFPEEDINKMLLGFYTTGQKKDGTPFSGTALLALRTALNRYLNQFCGRQISLANSPVFKPSNSVLTKIISSSIKTNRGMTVSDIELLYKRGAVSNNNPETLLFKVWFELQLHFRAKINWNKVMVEHFFFYEENGNQFVNWNTCAMAGTSNQVTVIEGVSGLFCPVASLKLYLAKRSTGCNAFLQLPAPKDLQMKGIWYLPEELRSYKEKNMLKRMSKIACLSQMYSNSAVNYSYEEFYQAMSNLNRSQGKSSSSSSNSNT